MKLYLDKKLSDNENHYLLSVLDAFGKPRSHWTRRSKKTRTLQYFYKDRALALARRIHHGEHKFDVPLIQRLAKESREALEYEVTKAELAQTIARYHKNHVPTK